MGLFSLLRPSCRRQLTRDSVDDLPLRIHLDFIVYRRQPVLEFFLSLDWGDELFGWLKEAYGLLLGAARAKARQLSPSRARPGTEPRNDSNQDMAQGETLKFGTVGLVQAMVAR